MCSRGENPWIFHSHGWLGLADFWRGRWEDAWQNLELSVKAETQRGAWNGMASGALFMARASAGDRTALDLYAGSQANRSRRGESNPIGSWMWTLAVVEGLALLDERSEAADFYPTVVEAIDTGTVLSADRVGGIAATAAEKWSEAERHFEIALRQAHEIPHRVEQPEVRRWYARMLLTRDGPGDRERARALIREAAESYGRLGMPRHVQMADELSTNL
jgi:hypothetical protein